MNKKAQSCSHRELEYYVLCAVIGEGEGNQRDLSAAGWFSRGRCVRLTCEGSWGKGSSFVLLFWGEGTSTTLGPREKSNQKAAGCSQATSVHVYDHGW